MRPKLNLDEDEIAALAACGHSLSEIARRIGVSHPVVRGRIQRWRREIASRIDDEADPATALFWLTKANAVEVARRWIWLNGDSRGAPFPQEPDAPAPKSVRRR